MENFRQDLVKIFNTLKEHAKIQDALTFLQQDAANTMVQQKQLVVIESPTFHEQERSKSYAQMLTEAGLKDVQTDDRHNVWGKIYGYGKTGKAVLLEGHLDTVFQFGAVKEVVEKDGKLYAPGICDDTRALAANLSVLRAFINQDLVPYHDIIIAGTVSEEGLGAMSGMKYLLSHLKDQLLATISIDGPSCEAFYYNATGMINYDVTYTGPGGHAYTAFGTPSAIHAMGRAIALLADIQVPATPKTTFTVSLVDGGQAIHGIAQKANFKINMRSDAASALATLEQKALAAFHQGALLENQRWQQPDVIKVNYEKIMEIPAGSQPEDAAIVQITKLATQILGIVPKPKTGGCTNGNMAIAANIPAVTLGRGGEEYGTHTLNEWFNPKGVYACEQKSLLMLLALAGCQNIVKPAQL